MGALPPPLELGLTGCFCVVRPGFPVPIMVSLGVCFFFEVCVCARALVCFWVEPAYGGPCEEGSHRDTDTHTESGAVRLKGESDGEGGAEEEEEGWGVGRERLGEGNGDGVGEGWKVVGRSRGKQEGEEEG